MKPKQQFQQSRFDCYKKDVPTPKTADPFQISDFYSKEKNKILDFNFQQVQKFNSEFFIESSQQRMPFQSGGTRLQQSFENPQIQFSVKLIFLKQQKFQQEITRKIESYFQEQKTVKFIFDRQYQKVHFSHGQSYTVKTVLVTQQGFERKLGCFQLTLNQQSTSNKQIILLGQQESATLCLKIQRTTEHWKVKLYYLQISICSIQQILDQKQRLVNKSEELNKITDILSLKGLYYQLTKQNMGSRILQKLLNRSHPEKVDRVYQQLKPHFSQMIKDRYGNYVFQKILELSTQKRRNQMFLQISQQFIDLVQTKTGTHTLQKLIKYLNQQGLQLVLLAIKNHQVKLSKNQFATHFMQKVIVIYPHYYLVCSLLQNFQLLACDKYAIVVLKNLLRTCCKNQAMKYHFLQKTSFWIQKLLYDQYGHYIIEELFKYYSWHQLYQINNFLVYSILNIGDNYYSSSVVKKSLQTYGDYIAEPLMLKILEKGLQQLLQSNSGSFVLQRIIDTSKNKLKHQMTKRIKQLIPNIKNYEKRNKWKVFLNIK